MGGDDPRASERGAGKPSAMSEAAARRLAERQAERDRRAATTLRANLQRRKAQSRERADGPPTVVDAPAWDHQNEPPDETDQD